MSGLSVRVRLTLLVALLAAGLGLSAATVGVEQVEDSLLGNAVDTAAAAHLDVVERSLTVRAAEGESSSVGAFLDAVLSFFEPRLTEPSRGRVRADALAGLLRAADPDGDGRIDVLTSYGAIVDVRLEGDSPPRDGPSRGPIVPTATLDAIYFHADGADADDPDLRFMVRSHEGVDYVAVAEVGDVLRAVSSIRTFAWAGLPVMVAVATLIAWLLTGRALRPVSAITGRVSEISARTLDERVPVPATDDEIADLARTMNLMLDRLEIDDRRLRQFVSDASHELRSPVAVLRSEAEVALRDPAGTSVAELAEGMLDESTRLGRIVEDLLVLARGEEAAAWGLAAVDVDEVVFAEAARRRRLPVDTAAVSAGRVWGSAESVGRVVAHLLDNAARHGASAVWVGLRSEAGQVVLWVDDDGSGIDEADRERVFERFVRLDEARSRDAGGAGIGLAVVAETVGAASGTVEVQAAPAGGARFVVRWPAAEDADDADDADEADDTEDADDAEGADAADGSDDADAAEAEGGR